MFNCHQLLKNVHVKDCIPYEVIHGRKPDLVHLQILSSTDVAHIPTQKRYNNFKQSLEKVSLAHYCIGSNYIVLPDSSVTVETKDGTVDKDPVNGGEIMKDSIILSSTAVISSPMALF